jgi:dipeptidyl aminopeptidase/acylaminoacyl peptidase
MRRIHLLSMALSSAALVAGVACAADVSEHHDVSISDLILLRDIGGVDHGLFPSPQKDQVAFQVRRMDVASNGYHLEWFVKSVKTDGPARSIGDGGEFQSLPTYNGRINGAPQTIKAVWSPDGKWLAYPVLRNGEIQAWRSSASGSTLSEQLTHNPADVEALQWSCDGHKLFFKVRETRESLAAADRSEGEYGYLFDARFLPYYSVRPLVPNNQPKGPTLWAFDFLTDKERPATEEEQSECKLGELAASLKIPLDVRDSVPSANGRLVAFVQDRQQAGADKRFYSSVAILSGDQPQYCAAPACSGLVSGLFWSADNEELFFLRRQGFAASKAALFGWRIKPGTVRQILETDDWIGDCSVAGTEAVCLHEASTTPRRIVAIDLRSGRLRTVYDPNPEFSNVQFTRVEKLQWHDNFGIETFGHLIYPKGFRTGQRYPLVVVQYRSRGFLRGGTGDEYPIHVFAANGFAVLSFDRPNDYDLESRKSGYELERAQLAGFYKRRSALSALENIVRELDQRGIIDLRRTAITGLSDGAETAYFALMHSDIFSVAITSTMPTDPISYYLGGLPTQTHLKALGYSAPNGKDAEYWRALSPLENVDRITAPLLVNIADREMLAAVPMVTALISARRPIEMYVYPDEHHIKSHPRAFSSIYERNLDWLRFWLQGYEDTTPRKAPQYERWRKLRQWKAALNVQQSKTSAESE